MASQTKTARAWIDGGLTDTFTGAANALEFSDDNYAESTGSESRRLIAYDFDFSIPSGATILDFYLEVERKSIISTIKDTEVYLKKPDSTLSDNKFIGVNSWENFDVTIPYGGSSDLWGLTIDETEINDVDFSVQFACENGSMPGLVDTAYIDMIRLTVFYEGGSEECEVYVTLVGECFFEIDDGTVYSVGDQIVDFELDDVCECVLSVLINGEAPPVEVEDGEEIEVELVLDEECEITEIDPPICELGMRGLFYSKMKEGSRRTFLNLARLLRVKR